MSNQANITITAQDRTAAAFASVSRQFDQLGFNAGALKGAIGGALAALAVPISAGAIASLVIESSKAIDEFNDLADATGASIENISALDRVARETGGSFSDVSSILTKFNKVLADAQPGKGAGAVLEAMNLDIEHLKRLDPAEALRQTAVALSQYADDGAKGRAITELFGKSVREVAPFLKDLSEQTALHATTSTQAAEEAEKFNKEIYQLKASAQDFARSLTVDVITALNETIAKFREGQREGKGFLQIASERYWENVRRFYGGAPEAGGGRGFVNPATVNPNAPRPSLTLPQESQEPKKATGARSGGGGAAKDPLAEARRYLESLQRQLEKTEELGVEERALAEIQSARMGKVNPALQQQILATARLIDLNKAEADSLKAMEQAANAAAEAAGKLHDEARSLAQEVETPYEKLQRQLEELRRASDSNPLIGAETAARLGTKYWQEYLQTLEQVNEQTSEFDLFTKNAAENIQGYLGETFAQIMDGHFENIGDNFVRMINRMVAEAAAANLARYLFGSLASGGSGDGALVSLIGNILGAVAGTGGSAMMASAMSGDALGNLINIAKGFGTMPSYDVGTDFVPRDQIALVHKGERIIPAAENKPGWGGLSVTNHFTLSQPADRRTQQQIASSAGLAVQRAMQRNT